MTNVGARFDSFSSSPIMVGVSFDLPAAVQHAIPRSVQADQIPRCPVVSYGLDYHVLFRPDGLFPHRLRPVALGEEVGEQEVWVNVEPTGKEVRPRWFVPRVGSYCRLVLPDQRRFTGRISRVVEYQQTRVILWVEHPHSPASITLAVPYPFFEGTRWWYIRLRSWFGCLRPDNDRHNSGEFPLTCADTSTHPHPQRLDSPQTSTNGSWTTTSRESSGICTQAEGMGNGHGLLRHSFGQSLFCNLEWPLVVFLSASTAPTKVSEVAGVATEAVQGYIDGIH